MSASPPSSGRPHRFNVHQSFLSLLLSAFSFSLIWVFGMVLAVCWGRITLSLSAPAFALLIVINYRQTDNSFRAVHSFCGFHLSVNIHIGRCRASDLPESALHELNRRQRDENSSCRRSSTAGWPKTAGLCISPWYMLVIACMHPSIFPPGWAGKENWRFWKSGATDIGCSAPRRKREDLFRAQKIEMAPSILTTDRTLLREEEKNMARVLPDHSVQHMNTYLFC